VDSLLLLRFDVLAILVRRCDMQPRTMDLTTPLVVEIFERRSFDVEVGASISCAANGRLHLHNRCSTLRAVRSRYPMAPGVGT